MANLVATKLGTAGDRAPNRAPSDLNHARPPLHLPPLYLPFTSPTAPLATCCSAFAAHSVLARTNPNLAPSVLDTPLYEDVVASGVSVAVRDASAALGIKIGIDIATARCVLVCLLGGGIGRGV